MHLRRIVDRHHVDAGGGVVDAADRIARQLQRISDHQDVGGLQLALDHVPVMQKRESVEDREQHLPRLLFRHGAMFQELGQGLVCILHDEVQIGQPVELTLTGFQELHQVGIGQLGGGFPLRAVRVHQCWYGAHEFDCNFARLAALELGEEDTAVIRGTQVPP